MDLTRNKILFITQTAIFIVTCFMIAGLFITQNSFATPRIFDFQFNPYALISFFSTVACLTLLVYVSRTKVRGQEAIWFALFISCILLYALFETFQRLSGTPEGAIFWSRLLGVIALAPVAALIFLLNYLKPNIRYIKFTTWLIAASLIVMFFFANGSVIYNNDVSKAGVYPWGYNTLLGDGFNYYSLWLITIIVSFFVLLLNFIRKSTNSILRRQAWLFIWAFLFPVAGGIVTEVIIPAFNDGRAVVVPLTAAFGTGTAAIMFWALYKHHALSISPALLSDEILSLMNESVIAVNRDMKIEYVNKESERQFASLYPQLTGQQLPSIVEESSIKPLVEALTSLKDDDSVQLNNIVLRAGPTHKMFARVSVSKIYEKNGIDGYILVINDVTELKKSYEALAKEKASIEETVQVRTQELREAQARLLETDKLKTEFVLLTSHNLRTPLTVVKGNLELLKLPSMSEEKKSSVFKNVEGSVQKLGELVEDLLTISTMEAGDTVEQEKVKVSDILEALLPEAERLAATSNNKLETHLDITNLYMFANPSRLKASIRNILDNAFKFTDHGTVTVEARSENNRLVLIIRDTGIGISEAEMPKLFTKFHRATTTLEYQYEGEGIGLYLSKLIIEDHKGSIDIDSKEHEGTTVRISLPLAIE